MNNLKYLQSMNIDQLVEFLNANGHHDAIWWKWFEEKYCDNCERITVLIPGYDAEETYYTPCVCEYCEEHNKCRFFPEMNLFDTKETIKLWLKEEVENA